MMGLTQAQGGVPLLLLLSKLWPQRPDALCYRPSGLMWGRFAGGFSRATLRDADNSTEGFPFGRSRRSLPGSHLLLARRRFRFDRYISR
jgi:hypothetical protein